MNTDCLGTSNCACGIICDLAAEFFGYAANNTAINRNVPHIPFRYVMEHHPKGGNESYQIARGAMWSLTCLSCGIWRQQSTSQFFSTVSGGNLPALPVESYLPYLWSLNCLTCLSCGIWRQQSTSQFFSTVSGGNLPALPVESYLPYLVHHQVQGIN